MPPAVTHSLTHSISSLASQLASHLIDHSLTHSLSPSRGLRVVNDDEYVLLVRRDQDLMFLRADAHEGQVVLRVEIPHSAASLGGELGEQGRVLGRGCGLHGGSDGDPVVVDDHRADDTLPLLDPVQRLFDVRHGLKAELLRKRVRKRSHVSE
eukprot:GHVU01004298.1.p1 GENE.GHVU01004298.1~~GHVU01004298.1.p1  ORF type:complete len:168 (+),score=1.30 GHVU01004298.1:48-506(+)